MTQPAPQALHIPGLITTNGVTPNEVPGQPVAAAQPGATVPSQPAAAPAPVAQAAPVAVTSAVHAAPVAQDPVPAATPAAPPAPQQLPTQLLPPNVATATNGVPGLNPSTATVPGLNPAPAPAPAPAAAAPAATPTPAQQPPASTDPATGTGETDRGYPQGTPLEQMSAEQREAYWKYHARQWESRAKERADYDDLKAKAGQYDTLVASQATETEQKISAAKAAGYQEAAAKAAVVLVDAHVRAGLQTRLGPDQVEALAANLNHQHFLAADGLSVDAAKVSAFVSTVAPQTAAPAATAPAAPAVPGALPTGVPAAVAPPQQQPVTGLPRALPDLGQGAQTQAPLDKLEAGRQQARAFLNGSGAFH